MYRDPSAPRPSGNGSGNNGTGNNGNLTKAEAKNAADNLLVSDIENQDELKDAILTILEDNPNIIDNEIVNNVDELNVKELNELLQLLKNLVRNKNDVGGRITQPSESAKNKLIDWLHKKDWKTIVKYFAVILGSGVIMITCYYWAGYRQVFLR